MRSFFDKQVGEFSLKVRCVCVYSGKGEVEGLSDEEGKDESKGT